MSKKDILMEALRRSVSHFTSLFDHVESDFWSQERQHQFRDSDTTCGNCVTPAC